MPLSLSAVGYSKRTPSPLDPSSTEGPLSRSLLRIPHHAFLSARIESEKKAVLWEGKLWRVTELVAGRRLRVAGSGSQPWAGLGRNLTWLQSPGRSVFLCPSRWLDPRRPGDRRHARLEAFSRMIQLRWGIHRPETKPTQRIRRDQGYAAAFPRQPRRQIR